MKHTARPGLDLAVWSRGIIKSGRGQAVYFITGLGHDMTISARLKVLKLITETILRDSD